MEDKLKFAEDTLQNIAKEVEFARNQELLLKEAGGNYFVASCCCLNINSDIPPQCDGRHCTVVFPIFGVHYPIPFNIPNYYNTCPPSIKPPHNSTPCVQHTIMFLMSQYLHIHPHPLFLIFALALVLSPVFLHFFLGTNPCRLTFPVDLLFSDQSQFGPCSWIG